MSVSSVSTVVFDGHPVETAYAELAALGLRWVEPAYIQGYTDFDETAFSNAAARTARAHLATAGLSARAISAHIDLAGPEAPAMLRRRMGFAAGIGARMLITNAAARTGRLAMLRCLKAALPEAETAGVTIARENPAHCRDALIPNAGAGAALLREITSPRQRLNYDCANLLSYNREGALGPDGDIAGAQPVIAHLHRKDAKRGGPDCWAYVPLGEGAVRLAEVVAQAGSIPIGIDLPLRLSRLAGGDPERRRPALPLPEIRTALRRPLDRLAEWRAQAAQQTET
jgi:sugar phosphate isomerase/epimerase